MLYFRTRLQFQDLSPKDRSVRSKTTGISKATDFGETTGPRTHETPGAVCEPDNSFELHQVFSVVHIFLPKKANN